LVLTRKLDREVLTRKLDREVLFGEGLSRACRRRKSWPCVSKVRFLCGQICDFPASSVGHAPSSLVRRRLMMLQPLATAVWKVCERSVVIKRLGGSLLLGHA